MSLSIRKTSAALGAEIAGVDIAQPIEDTIFEQIRQAFFRYEVIFIRGQKFSDADHLNFCARFGTIFQDKRHPEISVVSNIIEEGKHIGSYDAGLFWHTDGPFYTIPFVATSLHGLEVPEQNGRTLGDTVFASMTASYDALSDAMKKRLEGLEAVQSARLRFEKTPKAGRENKRIQDLLTASEQQTEAVHPVVRVHPVSGRRCLYVSEGYTARILGLPEDESRDLIAELTAHCVKPEFLYRHNWRVHDLVMWDDCSTQHKATFDYALPQRRLMRRTFIKPGLHP